VRGRYYRECSECWAYSSIGSGKCLLPSEVECPLGVEAPFPDQETFLEYIFRFDKLSLELTETPIGGSDKL